MNVEMTKEQENILDSSFKTGYISYPKHKRFNGKFGD